MNHVSSDELNELVDGRLSDSKKERVLGHLQECLSCSSACRQLIIIDRAARRQPLEKTNTAFVENTMSRIFPRLARTEDSRFERILKYSANLFALVIVIFMGYGIFLLVNHYLPGEKSVIPQIDGIVNLSAVREEISGGWNSLNTKFHHYLGIFTPQGKLPLWVYALWSIILIVIVEKIAGKWLRHLSQIR